MCAALVIGDGLALALFYVLLAALVAERVHIPRAFFSLLATHLAFLVWALVSVAFSGHGRPSSGEATLALAWGGVLVVALTHEEHRQRALSWLAVAAAIVSVFAIAQHFFGLGIVGEWLRVPEIRQSPLAPHSDSRFMASGFFFNRLKLAFTLGATLPLLVFTWSARPVLKTAVCALVGVALAFTYARSAMIATLCSLAAGMVAQGMKWKRVAAVSACVLAFVSLVPDVRSRIVSALLSSSYSDRAFIWERALAIFADNPLFGTGFGNYPRICGAYYDVVDPSFVMRTHAHDQWLSILTETGPVGLALFLAWLTAIARLLLRQRSAAGIAVFTHLCVVALVHDPLQHSASGLAYCCALGMTLRQNKA